MILSYTLVQVHLREPEADQLGNPYAGGVQQFQHGAVAVAEGLGHVGCGKQRFHVGLRQRVWQALADAGHFDQRRRILPDPALSQQVPIEAPERG